VIEEVDPYSASRVSEGLPLIVLVEDEQAVRTMINRILARDHRILAVENRNDLMAVLQTKPVQLVLLDIMLPGSSGLEIAKSVRALSDVPLIFISGLTSGEIISQGLNLGASDYITKPFDPLVLRARVRNVLRRNEAIARRLPARVEFGGLSLTPLERSVEGLMGREERLTEKELQLLMELARNSCAVVSRDRLSMVLTGAEWSPLNRVLDVHICNLRKKLRNVSGTFSMIAGFRKTGYMLKVRADFVS
jgi:DNA-binding response OmpR family regulator